MMFRAVEWLVMIALLLAGCSIHQPIPAAEAGPYPVDYKAVIKSYIRVNFRDPYSLQNVEISDPRPIGPRPAWWVCLRTDQRDLRHHYYESDLLLIFRQGTLAETAPGSTLALSCNDFTMSPWPEMNDIGDDPPKN